MRVCMMYDICDICDTCDICDICHTVYVIYNVYIYIYYINVYMVPPKKSIVITFTGICGIFAIMDNYF